MRGRWSEKPYWPWNMVLVPRMLHVPVTLIPRLVRPLRRRAWQFIPSPFILKNKICFILAAKLIDLLAFHHHLPLLLLLLLWLRYRLKSVHFLFHNKLPWFGLLGCIKAILFWLSKREYLSVPSTMTHCPARIRVCSQAIRCCSKVRIKCQSLRSTFSPITSYSSLVRKEYLLHCVRTVNKKPRIDSRVSHPEL